MRHYLDYFGFDDPTAFALSAGEKKLLDIVRCLLLKPSFLLLDEPTAGLPDDLTEKVMDVVRELAGRRHLGGHRRARPQRHLEPLRPGPLHGRGQDRPDRRPRVHPRAPHGRREVPGRRACLRTATPGIIEVKGLRSGYHGVTVLKGLDFEVGSEVFTVLGANGAGKTTLLATLARLLPLMGGTIRFAGEDVSHLPPYETAGRGIAYVPQEQGVFPNLTVLENLRVGGMVGVRPHEERLAEVFELFPALKDMQQQMAGTLSGGESRMVACGRALMQDPKVLLLDEPTAGLSPLYVDLFMNSDPGDARDPRRRYRAR